VNLPLITDTAGFRIAAAHEEAAGWIDGPLGEDTNDRNTTTVRGKLLVEPSDAFTISALGLYHESEQFVKSYSFDGYNSSQTNPSQARQEYEMGVLQIGYDFGAATLLSVSGVLHQEGRSVDDSTKFYQTLFGGPIIEDVLSDSTGDFTKWSQELRLTSNGDTRFKYMLGASYTDFDSDGYITADAVSLIPVPPTALGLVFTQESSRKSRIWAVFGNFSYDLTDWASLEFGGRYFSEDLETDSIFTLVDLLGPGADFVDITGGKATFETFNPKMGLNFKTGDSGIVYIDAARGFRSGGFNGVTDPSVSPTYDPEKLWTYEIGAKQSTLDGRLFVELAVYYNDYKDIQLNQVVNPTVATVLNGGRASGPGVDFIIQARPKEDLVFSASLGWNHLRFDTDSIDKLKEDPADLVPDWNFSTSVDYTPQLTDKLQLVAHADVGFIDQAQITLRSIAALGFDAVTPSEARTVANLKLGLACDRLEGYVFANNLLNEIKIVNPAFGAFFEPIYTQPRTLGVGLRARF